MTINEPDTAFSHVKPDDTSFICGGLRDFFTYRDLGVEQATGGAVIAQPWWPPKLPHPWPPQIPPP